MILPDLVFGRPSANWILSGDAIGPISVLTCCTSSFVRFSSTVSPDLSVTYA